MVRRWPQTAVLRHLTVVRPEQVIQDVVNGYTDKVCEGVTSEGLDIESERTKGGNAQSVKTVLVCSMTKLTIFCICL